MSYEEYFNGIKAEERAIKIREYCLSHKICDDCVFYIGTCKLNRFPWDWDFRREHGRDIRSYKRRANTT